MKAEEAGTLERGRIALLKKNFGFIKSSTRQLDVFFHLNSLQEADRNSVKVGQDVQYVVSTDPGSGRPQASQVTFLPPGAVVLEKVSQETFVGKVHDPCSSKPLASGLLQLVAGAKVHYVTYKECPQQPLQRGDLVTFRLVQDLKKAAALKESHHPKAVSIAHCAIDVAPLTAEQQVGLTPEQRAALLSLELLSAAKEATASMSKS